MRELAVLLDGPLPLDNLTNYGGRTLQSSQEAVQHIYHFTSKLWVIFQQAYTRVIT
jgi:hypothetical protein